MVHVSAQVHQSAKRMDTALASHNSAMDALQEEVQDLKATIHSLVGVLAAVGGRLLPPDQQHIIQHMTTTLTSAGSAAGHTDAVAAECEMSAATGMGSPIMEPVHKKPRMKLNEVIQQSDRAQPSSRAAGRSTARLVEPVLIDSLTLEDIEESSTASGATAIQLAVPLVQPPLPIAEAFPASFAAALHELEQGD